jgi:hypothetical protein
MAGDFQAICFVSFNGISQKGCSMSNQEWSRAMRAIWLLNTIEVDLSHLGIPLMRVPASMRDLGDALKSMSEQDRQLIEDELSNAHASLAQVVGELQAGMAEIETLLRQPSPALSVEQAESISTRDVSESTRSVVWQK